MAEEENKNPFEEMAESFFGQAAEYIKKTMDEIKGSTSSEGDEKKVSSPPPPKKEEEKPKVEKKKHFWFGEVD